jgi:hypothetical protein
MTTEERLDYALEYVLDLIDQSPLDPLDQVKKLEVLRDILAGDAMPGDEFERRSRENGNF